MKQINIYGEATFLILNISQTAKYSGFPENRIDKTDLNNLPKGESLTVFTLGEQNPGLYIMNSDVSGNIMSGRDNLIVNITTGEGPFLYELLFTQASNSDEDVVLLNLPAADAEMIILNGYFNTVIVRGDARDTALVWMPKVWIPINGQTLVFEPNLNLARFKIHEPEQTKGTVVLNEQKLTQHFKPNGSGITIK